MAATVHCRAVPNVMGEYYAVVEELPHYTFADTTMLAVVDSVQRFLRLCDLDGGTVVYHFPEAETAHSRPQRPSLVHRHF